MAVPPLSQGGPDLQKNVYIFAIKKLYTKLTYCDYPNKNVNTLTWKSQKFEYNKNKSNDTFTIISQQILCSK